MAPTRCFARLMAPPVPMLTYRRSAAMKKAYGLLLNKGLIRIGIPIPPNRRILRDQC